MRKVNYINVGDMPCKEAQEYLEAIIYKFKNRIVQEGTVNEQKREPMTEEFTTYRKEWDDDNAT
jgi:hypothetical protein